MRSSQQSMPKTIGAVLRKPSLSIRAVSPRKAEHRLRESRFETEGCHLSPISPYGRQRDSNRRVLNETQLASHGKRRGIVPGSAVKRDSSGCSNSASPRRSHARCKSVSAKSGCRLVSRRGRFRPGAEKGGPTLSRILGTLLSVQTVRESPTHLSAMFFGVEAAPRLWQK
jgi:hypothetical protein